MVGKIRERRAEELEVKAIANRLTAESIPTKTGKNRCVHTTGAWVIKRAASVPEDVAQTQVIC